jgi:TonB family protein
MSQTILVIEHEPRTTARIAGALGPLKQKILSARDLDEAVNACSKVEPQLVIITAGLPHVSVDDAILQLRARAGLKTTPFVVLMPGYEGDDPRADAVPLGAQYIVGDPFDDERLAAGVSGLLEAPRAQTVISTDRRSEAREGLRGTTDSGPTMTSEEIFGDLLEETELEDVAATTHAVAAGAVGETATGGASPPEKPRAAATHGSAEEALEATLADVLRASEKPARPREGKRSASVDELLSETLSGLETGAMRRRAPTPVEAAAESERPKTMPPAGGTELPAAEPVAPSPRPEQPVEGEAFGQYELIDLIATGGMAELYKARMQGVEGFQKIVAIKRILPHLTSNDDFVTMFIDEAKLAAQLQHPNIIHIYDLGKIEQSYYIAMEYIDGKDLRSILRLLVDKGQRMPLDLALHIGSRLAAALDYAHRKKDLHGRAMALVHRDVSPQNVLISFDGDIKLCDFGIAKAASKASHTRAGALKGKLQYMSPEQAWGKDLDGRSDIFSLGLVLYEAITGRAAFAGDSELSILEQVRSPHLTPPREIDPSIPEQVESVLLKALQERREDRFQTAGELVDELERVLQGMRPKPSSGDLGALLTRLTAPAPPRIEKPRVAAADRLPPRPGRATTAPASAAPGPPRLDSSTGIPAAPRRSRAVWLGLAAVVVVAIGIWALTGRRGGVPEAAAPTPAPGLEAALGREATEQVPGGGTATEQVSAPAAAAAVPVTAVPTRAPVATPTPVRQVAAVVPSALPTSVPTPVLPTPAPTEAVPTPVPTVRPTAPPTRPPTIPTNAPAAATPPPSVREGDLVELGPGVVQPVPVSTPKPAYPPIAARQRVGGVVILDVLVDENGNVQSVTVLRSVRADIDAAAVGAARNWRFTPGTKDGVRVKIHHTISIPFRP